jgi:hypothetical protein
VFDLVASLAAVGCWSLEMFEPIWWVLWLPPS